MYQENTTCNLAFTLIIPEETDVEQRIRAF